MKRKSKRAKACDISPAVRRAVDDRDGGLCILCGRVGVPNAHFISRAAGGLGVEKNIFTACPECHRAYDNSGARPMLRERIRDYLSSQYEEWDEKELYYKKGG